MRKLISDDELSSLSPREKLECLKLEAEARDLRRPFYKRWVFWTATTPVALAVLGLFVTWQQGWFDVKQTEIRVQRSLLDRDVRDLTAQRNTLNDSIRRVESLRDSLVVRYRKDSTEFAVKTESLRVEYQRAVSELRDSVAAVKSTLTAALDSLNREVAVSPVKVHFRQLMSDRWPNPRSTSVEALIEILRKGDDNIRTEAIGELRAAADTAAAQDKRGLCLYVLSKGTGQDVWKADLFDLISANRARDVNLQMLFVVGDWTNADYVEAVRLFLGACVAAKDSMKCDALCACDRLVSARGPQMNSFDMPRDTEILLDGIIMARDCVLESARTNRLSDEGLSVLKALAPAAYCVTMATVLSEGSGIIQEGFAREFNLLWRLGDWQYPHLMKVMKRLSFPVTTNDPEAWRAWLVRNGQLSSLWADDNLSRLRSDKQLLRQALEGSFE